MERLQWIFELSDRMSGPAGKIHQSVARVDQGLRRVDRAAAAADGGMTRAGSSFSRLAFRALPTIVALGRIAGAIQAVVVAGKMMGISSSSMRVAFRGMQAGAKGALKRLRDLGKRGAAALKRIPPSVYVAVAALGAAALAAKAAGAAFRAVKRVAAGIGLAALAAGFAGVALAVKGVTGAIDAMVARERNLRALTILSGGNEAEGLRLRERFANMSEFLGINPRDVQSGMQNLLTKGFSEVDAVRIFQGVSDVAAISPDADVSRIVLAMGQIRQAGALQGDELNQLAESGLPLEHVYERIAAAMGHTGENAAAWVKAQRGTIPAAIAIQGILEGIQDTTGTQLGGVAREASLGLGGTIERLKQLPTRFFDSLANESSVAGQRLTALLARLEAFLNPRSATGQRIIGAMVAALDMAVTAIEKIGGLLSWASTAGRSFIASIPPSVLERLTTGLKVIGAIIGVALLVPMASAALAIGVTVAAIAGLADWLGSLVQPVMDAIDWFDRMLAMLRVIGPQLRIMGASAVMGFVEGIRGGISSAVAAVSDLGTAVIGRLRGLLQIHSPSRVFMSLGDMTGEGFAIGLQRSMPGLDFDGVGAPSPGANASSLGAVAGGVGRGNVSVSMNFEVHAAPGEDTEDLASRIGETVRREVATLFEGFALESGVR